MRILHLSDIHLSKQKLNSNKYLLDAFLEDIKSHVTEKKFDFVLITGDLVDKGGDQSVKGDDCYTQFVNVIISPLSEILKIEKTHFYFIPGNHDIEEKFIDENYDDGFLKNTNTVEKVNKFLKENKRSLKNGLKRIKKFKEFEKAYYSNHKCCSLSSFESCFIFEEKGLKIGIAGFNSAWMCSPKRKIEQIVLGADQIRNAQGYFEKQKTHLNIGLIHHHPDLFSDFEKREIKSTFANSNIDILLCGHTHETVSEKVIGNRNHLFTSISKSSFGNPREVDSEYKSGYTILDINIDDEKKDIIVAFNYRVYIHPRESFDKDIYSAQDGRYEDKLIKKNISSELKDYLITKGLENKKQLDNEWNAITSRLIKSAFPTTKKKIVDIIREKMLPDILDHYVKGMELVYEIRKYDENHIELIETQEFDVVSNGMEFDFTFEYNIEKRNDESDKSDIETVELIIGGKSYLEKINKPKITLLKGGEEQRKTIIQQVKLEGKDLYRCKKVLKTIHSIKLNVYWKYDILRITDGLTIDIRQDDDLEVDLLGFGSNINLKQVSYNPSEIGKMKHYDLLMPGDGYILIIKPKEK